MKQNLTLFVWAILAAALMSSCDDPEVAFNEETFDIPFLFSEGYQDSIKYPYTLPRRHPTGSLWSRTTPRSAS